MSGLRLPYPLSLGRMNRSSHPARRSDTGLFAMLVQVGLRQLRHQPHRMTNDMDGLHIARDDRAPVADALALNAHQITEAGTQIDFRSKAGRPNRGHTGALPEPHPGRRRCQGELQANGPGDPPAPSRQPSI